MIFDYVIIGGGIVGISTAWQLKQRLPDASIVVVEKENHLAAHQTGHNSGGIHAGVYYQPGSMKAEFCRRGVEETIRFSQAHNIPVEQCGKLIVATDDNELPRLENLHGRCQANKIDCERLSAEELKILEPRITGTGAILAKTTGIADYPAICQTMGDKFEELGGDIKLGQKVVAVKETSDEVVVTAGSEEIHAHHLIVCAGMMSDRLADMLEINVNFAMIPFRGEYYKLPTEKNNIVKHLIYPVPDPTLPFLGVHLTRMIEGCVTVGPNAVLGFSREGYAKGSVNALDVMQMVRFGGFWRLMKQHLGTGIQEMKNSVSKQGYLDRCRKYCPELTLDDLQPYPTGIRAMAVDKNGTMIHDFLFADTPRTILVCNAPSPAATSAIPIGEHIVNKVIERFHT